MYLFTTISIIKGIRYLFIEKWGFNNNAEIYVRCMNNHLIQTFTYTPHQQWRAPNLNVFFCVPQLLSMIQWSYYVV